MTGLQRAFQVKDPVNRVVFIVLVSFEYGIHFRLRRRKVKENASIHVAFVEIPKVPTFHQPTRTFVLPLLVHLVSSPAYRFEQ